MANVYPFRAVQFKQGKGDVSTLVAPPYDVLDATGKGLLLAKDTHNVVAIDLPHTPPKDLGPAESYENAARLYKNWLTSGVLSRSDTRAMFAYRQTFKSGGTTRQRTGMACVIEVVPFGPREGGGVLPHEETFSGPKEDRFALMKATKAQLSPIFGLHADEKSKATNLLHRIVGSRPADLTADMGDGVKHEVWSVADEGVIRGYQEALKGEDVFIADGHHRYTTALNYGRFLGEVAQPDHPARRCMIVLVSMSDPGLVIWPTHRVLGGMKDYSLANFTGAAQGVLKLEPAGDDPHKLEAVVESTSKRAQGVLGLVDFASGKCFVAWPEQPDPLAQRFADKPKAWRDLDVTTTQYVVVEQVCQGKLNGGQPVKWAFPHTIEEVVRIGKGLETGAGGGKAFGAGGAQLAVILRPTPLQAVRDIGRANQLMPQKSTFFYPKIATGLWINPLE